MIHAFVLHLFVACGHHLVLKSCAMASSIRGHGGITSSCPPTVYLTVFFLLVFGVKFRIFGELFND